MRRALSSLWTAWLVAVLSIAVSGSGCSTVGGSTGGGRGEIGEVHLFGVPVALNLDSRPGPDGIGVRIYLTAAGRAQGMEMHRGRLEVLMFEGALTDEALASATPRKMWSYTPPQLAPAVGTSALGTGYQLALNWGEDRPRTGAVTVIARYHPPTGVPVVSTSSSIAVGN